MIDLKKEYGKKYRIALDESAEQDGQTKEERMWLYQLKCRRGHVYPHAKATLGAYCDKPPTIKRLIALPFVTVHQRGDRECTVLFDPSRLDEVLALLHPYTRRQVSDAERERLTSMSATHGFKKSNQPEQKLGSSWDFEAGGRDGDPPDAFEPATDPEPIVSQEG